MGVAKRLGVAFVGVGIAACSSVEEKETVAGSDSTEKVASERQAIHLAPLAIAEFAPTVQWGGRTVAVDIDATNANVAISAAESGGLFKTTNGGATWFHLDGLKPFRMVDVVISPSNPNIVHATAVNDTRTINGGGIWRSVDGGTTWQKPATSTPAACPRASAWGIAYSPDSNFVFIGTDCGLAVSSNLGATWTHVAPDPALGNVPVTSVAAQAGGIVDVLGNAGHYRSTGNGAAGTWSATTNLPGTSPFGGGGISAQALAASPVESNVLFAVTNIAGGFQVWESDNAGGTWNALNPPLAGTNRPPYLHTHVSADGDPQHIDLYMGDGVLTRRQTCTNTSGTGTRCSTTWNTPGLDHADPSDIAYATGNNCPIFQSSDSGVQTTTDCGANWTTTATSGAVGHNALQAYEVTGQVHPDHTDFYFGTQDDDIWASSDNGVTWPNRVRFEGWFLEIPHAKPTDAGQIMVGTTCGACVIFTSPAHFAGAQGVWPSAPSATSNPWVIDTQVYVQFGSTMAGNQLYLTQDTGGTWTPVTNAVLPSITDRARISGPAATPTLFQTVSIATGTGLSRIEGIRSGTATVFPASSGLVNIDSSCNGQGTFRCPTTWGVAPSDPDRLIAADRGTSEMKFSIDGGDSWQVDAELTALVKGNGEFLFPTQAHMVGFDPTNSQRVLVGTEAAGIMASFDGGNSWMNVPGSRRIPAQTTFFFDETRAEVTISSYGRGLWQMGWCAAGADATPPTFTFVPPDITTSNCGTIDLGTPRTVDVCNSGAVTITNNRPAKFPPGTTLVTWTATDAAGNTRTATQRVTLLLGDDPACCPAGTNVILGTSNNDVLNGTGGSDCIFGRGAQDTINAGGGNDFISGGHGDDVLNAGTGNDLVFGGPGQDRPNGEAGNDDLFGGDGDDILSGGTGNDTLHGGQGQDQLNGDDQNDLLFGDTGNDTLNGGAGDDNLVGGDGNVDTCSGGSGVNTFATCETPAASSCADGVMNGTETALDCGGGCGTRCADGLACVSGNDCESLLCVMGICAPSSGIATSVNGLLQPALTITSDWGAGYCAALDVINNAFVPTINWSVIVTIPQATTFTTWNGNFSLNTGTVTVSPSFSWNQVIPALGTDNSIGFCANRTPGTSALPSVSSATGTFF
jgi:hypothetical protein